MDDQEFLAQRIKDIEASVAYFSPGNKQVAERWVASSFIENLRIPHTESEIISPDDDPPDVVFRDARFEIKEILDPGRRRHDEYKDPVAVRSSLDLLFYVNLMDVFKVIELPYPDTSGLEASGWRSVSFVMGQRSCCFFARSDAPSFIRHAVGYVSHLHPR